MTRYYRTCGLQEYGEHSCGGEHWAQSRRFKQNGGEPHFRGSVRWGPSGFSGGVWEKLSGTRFSRNSIQRFRSVLSRWRGRESKWQTWQHTIYSISLRVNHLPQCLTRSRMRKQFGVCRWFAGRLGHQCACTKMFLLSILKQSSTNVQNETMRE